MFKGLFSRKKVKQNNAHIDSEFTINFKDLTSQDIIIKTKQNGNKVIFSLSTEKNKFEMLLDEEQCAILMAILHDFVKNKNLNNTYNILKEEG